MAIALVQTATINASGATSATTAAISVSAGDLLIADANASTANGADLAASPISDSRTQTWVNSTGKVTSAASSNTHEKYVASAAAGSTTFTVTFAASAFGRITVAEFSGAVASPLDVTGGGTQTIASGANTGPASGTLGQAAEMVWCTVSNRVVNGFVTFSSIGGGFTAASNVPDSSGIIGMLATYQIVNATSSVQLTFNGSVGDAGVSTLSSWKAAAGGGGTVFNQAVGGATAPISTVKRAAGKPVAAATSPFASLRRAMAKPIAAASHPLATLAVLKVVLKALDASCHAAASLRRSVGKNVFASVAPVGSLVRAIATFLTALVRPRATVASEGGTRLTVGVIVPGGEGPGGSSVIVPGAEIGGGVVVIVPGPTP